MKRIAVLVALALALTLAACSQSEVPTQTDDIFLRLETSSELDTSHHLNTKGTYRVTIENLTEAQPFTPPVAATHPFYLRLFIRNWPATFGVKEIAENGNVAPLAEALADSPLVTDTLVALGDPPPILPGSKRSFEIDGRTRGDVLSFVSMLVCTNDGFTGRAIRLPRQLGQVSTRYAIGYDAGTEINTEAFEDIVPPCAQITLGKDEGGTGMSNPALAENSVVKKHPNIEGLADLIPSLHGWDEPVAKITVERIK